MRWCIKTDLVIVDWKVPGSFGDSGDAVAVLMHWNVALVTEHDHVVFIVLSVKTNRTRLVIATSVTES
jgi:hypothetical protein